LSAPAIDDITEPASVAAVPTCACTIRPDRRLGWEIEDLADELSDLIGRPVDLVSRRAPHALLRAGVLAQARPCNAA
jgi:hypothetical protein